MQSPFARLAFWYAALGMPEEGRPLAYPFGSSADTDVDGAARRFAASLRGRPAGERAPLLRVLQAQASLLPWSALHPSWLSDVLLDCPPQWRLWALAVLPTSLREKLQIDRPETAAPALLDAQPPAWWPAWFQVHVKRRLAYPDLAPWDRAGERDALPGSLWERSEVELVRALAVHGTRGFVSVVRQLPREEAPQWMWRLPIMCQAVAQETVQKRLWSEDPFWPAVFDALAAEFPDVEARVFRIALADWLRAGVAQGQEASLRRLAFRLPRRWGEWMLRELAARPEWLSRPVAPSLEAWRSALARDMAPPGATAGASS